MSARDIVSFGDAFDPYSRRVVESLRRGSAVASLADVERGMAAYRTVKTIDLIGHASTEDRLLRLGSDLVDTRSPRITAMFARLAAQLRRLGARELRLLGCSTAVTVAARRSLKDLARILEPVAVFGTVDLVAARQFDARGLRRRYERTLIAATDLR